MNLSFLDVFKDNDYQEEQFKLFEPTDEFKNDLGAFLDKVKTYIIYDSKLNILYFENKFIDNKIGIQHINSEETCVVWKDFQYYSYKHFKRCVRINRSLSDNELAQLKLDLLDLLSNKMELETPLTNQLFEEQLQSNKKDRIRNYNPSKIIDKIYRNSCFGMIGKPSCFYTNHTKG